MNVLVTGGSGKLGLAAIDALLEAGHEVINAIVPGRLIRGPRSERRQSASLRPTWATLARSPGALKNRDAVSTSALFLTPMAMRTRLLSAQCHEYVLWSCRPASCSADRGGDRLEPVRPWSRPVAETVRPALRAGGRGPPATRPRRLWAFEGSRRTDGANVSSPNPYAGPLFALPLDRLSGRDPGPNDYRDRLTNSSRRMVAAPLGVCRYSGCRVALRSGD